MPVKTRTEAQEIAGAIRGHAGIMEDVAQSIASVGTWVKYLGGGENSDSRGAMEFHAIETREGLDAIATAIGDGIGHFSENLNENAVALSESLDNIASAIRELAHAIQGGGCDGK